MTVDRRAFLETIKAADAVGTPAQGNEARLVFADWLEELGERQAEYIREAVELAVMRAKLPPLIEANMVTVVNQSHDAADRFVPAEQIRQIFTQQVRIVVTHENLAKTAATIEPGDRIDFFLNEPRAGKVWITGGRVGEVESNLDGVYTHGLWVFESPTITHGGTPEPWATHDQQAARVAAFEADKLALWRDVLGLPSAFYIHGTPPPVTLDRGVAVGLTCSWEYCREHLDAALAVQPVRKVKLTDWLEMDATFVVQPGQLTDARRLFVTTQLEHRWPSVEFELPPHPWLHTDLAEYRPSETLVTRLTMNGREVSLPEPIRLREGERLFVRTDSGEPVIVTADGYQS